VWVDDISKMKKADWKKYIRQSYKLVEEKLPGKVQKELGLS
jgi:predicted DNA-binding protein (MmcQ/YjbR family)